MKKILLTTLVILGLCLALSVSAQIELEQTYPAVPGSVDGLCCGPPSGTCSAGYTCEGGEIVGCDAVNGPAGTCVSAVQQTLTGKARLPDLIKYFTNWALIIAALAVVISLVIAGIQYLTSSGRPEKMTDARKKIGNSLLGLAILAGSYLILVTINPQLTVMTLVVTPVDSGIAMFTEDGYESFTSGTNPQTLTEILRDGQARLFHSDIADLEAEFGPLVQAIGGAVSIAGKEKVNFAKFSLYAIAFWGRPNSFADNVEIKMHNGKDFQKIGIDPAKIIEPNVYGRGADEKFGKHTSDDENTIDREADPFGGNEPAVKMIWIEQDTADPNLSADNTDFFLSKAKYATEDADTYAEKVKTSGAINWVETTEVYHPPLSISIQGMGTGVYLYSEKEGHRYLRNSNEDFSLSDLKFDNLASKIEIGNYERDDKVGERPSQYYLAVLHDYYNFSGSLRVFFEKDDYDKIANPIVGVKPKTHIPIIYFHDSFRKGDLKIKLCEGVNKATGQCIGNGLMKDGIAEGLPIFKDIAAEIDDTNYRFMGKAFNSGNIEKDGKLEINASDQYGGLGSQKVSSIQILQVVDPISITEEFSWKNYRQDGGKAKECREVRLCTEKGGAGNCISYTPGGRVFPGAYDSVTLPMPYFITANIPHKIKGVIKNSSKAAGEEYEIKEFDVYNNIKSIYIRGDCMVALFENPIIDLSACIKCDPYSPDANCQKCFEGGLTGSHSETFLATDWNLSDNEIGRCGGKKRFGMGSFRGCASSIAVFPIKIAE